MRERGSKEFEWHGKDSENYFFFYISQTHVGAYGPAHSKWINCKLHCHIKAYNPWQEARPSSILNYSASQYQCSSSHSWNPVSRLANVHTDGAASFLFFSFLFFSAYATNHRRLLRRSLHTHERLRQHQGITRCDTSRTEIIVDECFFLHDTCAILNLLPWK